MHSSRARCLTTLLVSALVIAACAIGISRLTTSADNRVFFGTDDEQFNQLLDFEEQFASYTSVVFVVAQAEPGTGVDLAPAVRWLTEESWKIPSATKVTSIANFPHAAAIEDDVAVDDLIDLMCVDDQVCDLGKVDSLGKQYLTNLLVNANQNATTVIATLTIDHKSSTDITRIYRHVDNVRTEFVARYPNLGIYVSGGLPMMQAFVDAANHDAGTLIPLALCVFLVLLLTMLGSIKLTLSIVGMGVGAIVVALGIAGWTDHVLNTATSTVPLVVLTLTIASGMHIFLAVSRDRREISIEERYADALDEHLTPILLANLTTAIGLLSLTFVPSPPIRELGYLSAIGVTSGTALLALVAPAISKFLPRRSSNSAASSRVQFALRNLAIRLYESRLGSSAVLLLFVFSLPGVLLINVDDDFVKYFDPDSSFRTDTEYVTQNMFGPYGLEIVVGTDVSGGVFEPNFLGHIDTVTSTLRDDSRVRSVFSFSDVLFDSGRVFGITRSNFRDLGSDAIAQSFLAYELSLAEGQSTNDLLDIDRSSARISVVLEEATSKEVRSIVAEFEGDLLKNDEYPTYVTGEIVPTAFLSPDNIRAMFIGIGLSIFLSVVLLSAFYKSLVVGAISLIAIFTPVAAGFGLWGWLSGDVGLATAVIVAVTLGVVIDDTIHMVHRYYELNRSGAPKDMIIQSLFLRSGIAVTATSIVLAAGFSVMLFSGFQMNSAFGTSTAIIVSLALLFDITLLPRLLEASGGVSKRG